MASDYPADALARQNANRPTQKSAGRTLEEMDYLFTKGRAIFVFADREVAMIGSPLDRDLAQGEVLRVFDADNITRQF